MLSKRNFLVLAGQHSRKLEPMTIGGKQSETLASFWPVQEVGRYLHLKRIIADQLTII